MRRYFSTYFSYYIIYWSYNWYRVIYVQQPTIFFFLQPYLHILIIIFLQNSPRFVGLTQNIGISLFKYNLILLKYFQAVFWKVLKQHFTFIVNIKEVLSLMIREARISGCIVSLLERIENLLMKFLEEQGFWTLFFIYAISKVLMICVKPQISLVLFGLFQKISFFSILDILANPLVFLAPTMLYFIPLLEIVVVWPKIEVVFILLDFGCVVNILFAFRGDVRGNNFYLDPLEVFKVKVGFLFKARSDHLLLINHALM